MKHTCAHMRCLWCARPCAGVRVRMLFWPSLTATSSTRLCRPARVFSAVSREWKPDLYWVSIKRNESGNMRGYCTPGRSRRFRHLSLSHSVPTNVRVEGISFLPASSSSLISSLSKSALHKAMITMIMLIWPSSVQRPTSMYALLVEPFPIMFRAEHVVNQIGIETRL